LNHLEEVSVFGSAMSASLIPDVILKYYDENTSSCNELIMVSIIAGCLLIRCTRPSVLLTILFVHYSLTVSDFKKYNYVVFILLISVGMIFRKKNVKKDIIKKVDKLKIKTQDVKQLDVSETASKIIEIMAKHCPQLRREEVLKMISEYKDKGGEQKILDDISIEFGLIPDSEITGAATVPTTPSKTGVNAPLTTTPSATTPGESSSSIKADRYKNAREEAKLLHDQVQRERLEARIAQKTPKKNNRIISDDCE
jgi:hypothetical protein